MSPASASSGVDFSNNLNEREMPMVPGLAGYRLRLEGVVERDAYADCGLAEVVVNHALAVP
jgi:hypothetical protein